MTPASRDSAARLPVLLDAFWTEVHDLGMVTGTGDSPSTREAYRVSAVEARAELEAAVDAALAEARADERRLVVEQIEPTIHEAMCDVSHHDQWTTCKNQRKYELVAEHMVRLIEARSLTRLASLSGETGGQK